MRSVAILVLNDFMHDARVRKEAHTLSFDYRVTVFALKTAKLPDTETLNDNCQVYRKTFYGKGELTGVLRKIQQAAVYLQFFYVFLRHAKNFDIVHCNDLETLPMGVISRLFARNIKIVYDAHEYETETQWLRNPAKKWFARKIEKWAIAYVDTMCVVSEGIRGEYKRIYGLDNIHLVLNAPNLVPVIESQDLFRRKFGIPEFTPIFLYQGGLTRGRGIEIVLETFERRDMEQYAVVFMGYGDLRARVCEVADRCPNIYMHDVVPAREVLRYTASADYGICFIEDTCLNYRFCSPNKVFEYIMACLPVLVSDLVELTRLVETTGVGVAAKSNTASGLKEAIEELLTIERADLREALLETRARFNWESQEESLRQMYASLE